MSENILLVDFKSGNYRPSLGLARISTLHKQIGDNVLHAALDGSYMLPEGYVPDRVYVSIVFSWSIPYLADFVSKLKYVFPHLNEEGRIVIGGITSSFMEDYIKQAFGISSIQTGCSKELDHVIPDWSIFTEDETYVMTMRKCPNNCPFCAVPVIEPERWYINNWKDQIDMSKKFVVVGDNNPFAASLEHRKDMFGYFTKIAHKDGVKVEGSRKLRCVEFDGGFDWRYINEENLELIKDIKWSKVRFAWDNVSYEQGFDRAMKLLLKYFPATSKRGMHESLYCYVLYNFYTNKDGIENFDTLEDTLYRLYKLIYHYHVNAYVMRYQPLDTLSFKSYVSPYWNERDCVDIGRFINSHDVFWQVKYYRYYYGRKADGTCLNSCKDTTLKVVETLRSMFDTPLQLDFNKSYTENLHLLKEEIKIRNEALSKMQEVSEQLYFPIVNMQGGLSYGA